MFPGPWPGSGFYQVMLPDSDRVDFIIDAREPKISLVFSGTPLQEHMHVMASEENKRLWEYKLLSREAQAIQAAIRQERAGLDGMAVLRLRELDSLERRAQAVQTNHLSRLISADNKGYFSKAVGAGRIVENALTVEIQALWAGGGIQPCAADHFGPDHQGLPWHVGRCDVPRSAEANPECRPDACRNRGRQ